MEELNSGPPKTNPSCDREEDLNPGSLDYKPSALPLGHTHLPKYKNVTELNGLCTCKITIFYIKVSNDVISSHVKTLFLTTLNFQNTYMY